MSALVQDVTGLGSVFDFGSKVIDKIFPDKTAANAAQFELLRAQQAGNLADLTAQWDNLKAQIAVNQTEASSTSLWVSGWRPFFGWVCGTAYAYAFVVQPILAFICKATGHPIDLPPVDLTGMMPVLLGMLGVGAMRSYDKANAK